MRSRPQTIPWLWFLAFAVIFCLQVIPRTFEESPTFDEPGDLTNGYFYWSGDVVTHAYHPPLAKALQSLPLRALHLQCPPLRMGDMENILRPRTFLFTMNSGAFPLTFLLGRWVTLLLGLALGALLFWTVRKDPPIRVLAVLVLWAFEPTLLAFSGLVIADLPVTFFFLAAVLAFKAQLDHPGFGRALAAGVLLGMAVCCKFSGLALVPVFLGMEVLHYFFTARQRDLLDVLKDWSIGFAGFVLSVGLIYLPGTLLAPSPQWPWTYFFEGFMKMVHYSDTHHPSFFLGQASRTDHWLYYPLAFLLKSTLPFSILLLVTLAMIWKGHLRFQVWLWFPPIVMFLSIVSVQNLGIRYLLPAYPFLILLSAQAVEKGWNWRPSWSPNLGRILMGGLLGWHLVTTLAHDPYQISYFNDLVPQGKKSYFLGDSNLDWGQDMARLAQTAQAKGWPRVKLAQFGGLDASLYGLHWEPWTQRDLKGPQKGCVYAINLSMFQLGPSFFPQLKAITQGWISRTKPTGWIGETWVYYEFPGKHTSDSTDIISSVCTF